MTVSNNEGDGITGKRIVYVTRKVCEPLPNKKIEAHPGMEILYDAEAYVDIAVEGIPKTLIINCYKNGTPTELVKVVKKFSQYKVVPFRDINANFQIDKDIDAIVISGSAFGIASETEQFEGVINLIKTCNLPLLGICFGHQLLCLAFNAEMKSLDKAVECFEKVQVIETDEIFSGFKVAEMIRLAEHHNDYVSKESLARAGFTLLAESKSCPVEAVKHKAKPFYGVQFHPERTKIKKIKGEEHLEGYQIVENFYKKVVSR